MSDPATLVAIDAGHGRDLAGATGLVVQMLTARDIRHGVSVWNASGLFSDVAAAPADHRAVSPRTLLLLYAADLAFRLRWQIVPALDSRTLVIASPYVATAVAFGLANGLSAEWLDTLFRFAPRPRRTVILREDRPTRRWKRRPDRGFCECSTALLDATPAGFARRKTRAAMLTALSTLAERHGGLARPRDLRRLVASWAGDARPSGGAIARQPAD